MDASLLLPLWRSDDAESQPHLLAEDATFSSPVTDYHGRAQAAYMLGLIARVHDIVEQGLGLAHRNRDGQRFHRPGWA